MDSPDLTEIMDFPMYTMNKFEARSFAEMLQPRFRSIKFESLNNNIKLARCLRSAWKGVPVNKKPHYGEKDVEDYLNLFLTTKPGDDPTPRDKHTAISTPWRHAVYEMWNRLFIDVMEFLPVAAPDIGHFHAPNHSILPITQNFHKLFSTDVLIVPAYLQPGIKITITEDQSQPARIWGSFSSEDEYDIWFLKKGVPVKFEVEGGKEDKDSLKAVLVYGVVCNEFHSAPAQEKKGATSSKTSSSKTSTSGFSSQSSLSKTSTW
jgi:hypothetical protein